MLSRIGWFGPSLASNGIHAVAEECALARACSAETVVERPKSVSLDTSSSYPSIREIELQRREIVQNLEKPDHEKRQRYWTDLLYVPRTHPDIEQADHLT